MLLYFQFTIKTWGIVDIVNKQAAHAESLGLDVPVVATSYDSVANFSLIHEPKHLKRHENRRPLFIYF